MIKTAVKIIEIQVKQELNFIINVVSLMKSIIGREATFENNLYREVTQKKLLRAFVKDTQ